MIKIAQLERNATDNGVFIVHWTASKTDGEFTASSYGTQSFTPDPTSSDFVPYEELTEETVIGWFDAEFVTQIEERLDADILAQKQPQTLTGVPWQ